MKYTVLWIDDEPSQFFIEKAEEYEINIISKLCYEEGIAWLKGNRDYCDAVILDVNCKHTTYQEKESMQVFTDYAIKVYALCDKEDKLIPWFVYTAGGYDGEESLMRSVPNSKWSAKLYYHKTREDAKLLLEQVIKASAESENVRIRSKYHEAFSICTEEMEKRLLDVVRIIESDKTTDTSIYNTMRKLLNESCEYCVKHGLLPEGMTLSKDTRNYLRSINQAKPMEDIVPTEIVPSYISWIYSTCHDRFNNGSHSETEADPEKIDLFVDKDVMETKAPYLGRASFYELLTLFAWMSNLPQKPDEIKALQDKINALNINIKKNNVGKVEFDGKYYHCGNCRIPNAVGAKLVNKKVMIKEENENIDPKSNTLYPKFGKNIQEIQE